MANVDRDKTIEDEPTQPQQVVQSVNPLGQRQSSPGTLELNRATEAELAEIDFIGKKLAQAIVAQRNTAGAFRSWDDVARVPGLDAKRVAELQRATRLEHHS